MLNIHKIMRYEIVTNNILLTEPNTKNDISSLLYGYVSQEVQTQSRNIAIYTHVFNKR